jgi:hypothetical protein
MGPAILIFALILRLINLNQPLWLDEAIQAKAVSRFSLAEFFQVYAPTDFNPPLSYLVNFGLSRIFGFSEAALRLPSVAFGVLTIWLLYRLAGKWPALLLATSGLHIYYSQEARMYSLATLAVTASFVYLKNRQWLGYWLAILAAVYSHYLTVLVLPAHFWLAGRRDRASLLKSWLAVAAGFFPWWPIFWRQLQAGLGVSGTVWGGVIGGLSAKNLLLIPVKFLVGRISLNNNYLFAGLMAPPLALAAWLMWRGRREKTALCWLLVPLGLSALLSWLVPVMAYFRLLFILPAFYWLMAAKPAKFWLTVMLMFNLATAGIYLFNPRFHREDWRSLAHHLDERPVVITAAVDAPLRYYRAGRILDTSIVPEEDFWYVAYAEAIFDPDWRFRQQAGRAGFREIKVQTFRGDLTLIQYTR